MNETSQFYMTSQFLMPKVSSRLSVHIDFLIKIRMCYHNQFLNVHEAIYLHVMR